MLKEIAFEKRVRIASAVQELRRPPSITSSDATSVIPHQVVLPPPNPGHVSTHYWKEYSHTAPTSEPEQKPTLPHTPRHDDESVFWLLWFLLARANPQSEASVKEGSAEKGDYDTFCTTMLHHTVGGRVETLAGMSIEQYRQTLHPRFAQLGDMLYYMGKYFLIDPKTWCDYNKDLSGQACDFMKFLLLGELLRSEESGNLPLDITQPRPATDHNALVRRSPVVPVESRGSHNYAASLTQDNPVSYSVSSSSSKQKPDTEPQDSPPKRGRSSRNRSSHQDHAALAGAPQTDVHPEIAQPERIPFCPTPDRAEANEEDGRTTEDENPEVEQANYVASQETLETKEQLELAAFNKGNHNRSLIQLFAAVNDFEFSMLRGERWLTPSTK